MMGEAMCTPLFHNQFRVPTYQDWVDHEADWSHVYAFHQRQLQHLQWRNRRERWVLKTGAHLWGLEHLLATYPDARIVFTHRDPVKSMTSYASLTSLVRTMGSDEVDPHEIAARLDRAAEARARARRSPCAARRSTRDAVFYDMQFPDFVARPVRGGREDLRGARPADDGARRRAHARLHRGSSERQGRHPPLRAGGVRRRSRGRAARVRAVHGALRAHARAGLNARCG